MTFTNTQTKLGQAITTNDSGDYAVRTIIEGDQTLENLTLTGDLNGGGGHILNDQTNINQDALGPAFSLDGTNDKIAVANNVQVDITTGDFSMYREIYVKDLTSAITLWEKWEDAGDYWYLQIETTGAITFKVAIGTVTKGLYSSAAGIVTAGKNIKVGFVSDRDGTKGQIYFNLLPVTTTETTAMAATSLTNTGALNFGFDGASDYSEYEDQYGSFWNLAHTAAQVKDVKNIPFKWQYGSQTSLATGDDSDFDTVGNWTGAGATITGGYDSGDAGHTTTLRIEADDTASNRAELAQSDLTEVTIAGRSYRLEFDYKWITAPSVAPIIEIGGWATVFPEIASSTWQSFSSGEFTALNSTTQMRIYVNGLTGGTAADELLIDNLTLVPLGAVALYDQTSITANNWFDLANGNTGAVTGASVLNPKGIAVDEDNIPLFSVTSGITAAAGSSQGDGVLTSSINQIATCGTSGDAVTLPAAKPGKVLWVVNDGANASDVFPASGDNIDEAGANTAKSLPADEEMQFICTSAGHWSTITSE